MRNLKYGRDCCVFYDNISYKTDFLVTQPYSKTLVTQSLLRLSIMLVFQGYRVSAVFLSLVKIQNDCPNIYILRIYVNLI